MNILLISPLVLPITENIYGSVEVVIANIAREMMEKGHDVTIAGGTDSYIKGAHTIGVDKSSQQINTYDLERRLVRYIEPHLSKFDIIHTHTNFKLIYTVKDSEKLNIISTFHGLPDFHITLTDFPCITAVSNYIAKSLAISSGTPIRTVYNGINLSDYDYSDQKSDRLLFCSTLLREKGIAQAIDIANRNPLDIIGEDMRIIDQSLPIHLIQGNNTWKYYGRVGHYIKRMFMRGAKCLLFPVQRDEPGALIPLEAFASGTPVIATNRGCLPEYIENGVNGFLFNTVEEARNILKNDINKIKPIDCYNTAKRFTSEIMADNYLNFYDKMLSGERW